MNKFAAAVTLAFSVITVTARADEQSANAQSNWLKARQAQFAGRQQTHAGMDAAIADLKTKTAALVAAAGTPSTDIAAPPIVRRVPNAIREIWDDPAAPQMMVIPAGSYTMGSPDSETGHLADESPLHRVTINNAFALGKYPVTVAEYGRFAEETHRPDDASCTATEQPHPGGAWKNTPGLNWRHPGFAQTQNDPVVCVSWNDAQQYAAWLSQKTGKTYRLPSESEWQYAARAGTSTVYYWGDKPSHDFANYGGDDDFYCGKGAVPGKSCVLNGAKAGRDQWFHTSPVGSFPPNPFGLYDMLGNAWQLTQDCYMPSYAAPTDGSAIGCTIHSTMGGGWFFGPRYMRPAFRGRDGSDARIFGDGFRIARTL